MIRKKIFRFGSNIITYQDCSFLQRNLAVYLRIRKVTYLFDGDADLLAGAVPLTGNVFATEVLQRFKDKCLCACHCSL